MSVYTYNNNNNNKKTICNAHIVITITSCSNTANCSVLLRRNSMMQKPVVATWNHTLGRNVPEIQM